MAAKKPRYCDRADQRMGNRCSENKWKERKKRKEERRREEVRKKNRKR